MEKNHVLILNDREGIPEDSLDEFKSLATVVWAQSISPKEAPLSEAFRSNPKTTILVSTYMDLSEKNLKLLPKLQTIITTTTAIEFIDKEYCESKNISIINTAGYTGSSVAEFAIALMFSAARSIPRINSEVRKNNFNMFDIKGIELSGKTAGIIGLGNIGARIADVTHGIGMNTIFFNRSKKTHPEASAVSLDILLTSSDVIFISVPLNAETNNLINEERMSIMKDSVIIISTSPDNIIDLITLKNNLRTGKIRAAGLDLHGKTNLFHDCPNIVLSSRRAWFTEEAFIRRINTWKKSLSYILQKT